jgi:hypothetical protein
MLPYLLHPISDEICGCEAIVSVPVFVFRLARTRRSNREGVLNRGLILDGERFQIENVAFIQFRKRGVKDGVATKRRSIFIRTVILITSCQSVEDPGAV